MTEFLLMANWLVPVLLALFIYRLSYNWLFRRYWGEFSLKRLKVIIASICVLTLMLALLGMTPGWYFFLFLASIAFGAGAIRKHSLFA